MFMTDGAQARRVPRQTPREIRVATLCRIAKNLGAEEEAVGKVRRMWTRGMLTILDVEDELADLVARA